MTAIRKLALYKLDFQKEEIAEDYPIRVDIDTSLFGKNKRQTYTIFGQITKNTTIILVHMGKIKGFLFAVRHREILMTDLGLMSSINDVVSCRKSFSS